MADLEALARACRISGCGHGAEPGCAVRRAIEAGELDPERLSRYRKLAAEDANHSRTLAERRAHDRAFGKHGKAVMQQKRQRRRMA